MKNKKIIVSKETKRFNNLIQFIINQSLPDEEWREVKCQRLAEQWKKYIPTDRNEGVYFVSNKGRFISLYNPDVVLLVLGTDKTNGYNQVSIARTDEKKKCDRHILIAENFIGDTHGKEVHHKDGNKHNNKVENLEILTKAEHLKRHGKKPKEKEVEL